MSRITENIIEKFCIELLEKQGYGFKSLCLML